MCHTFTDMRNPILSQNLYFQITFEVRNLPANAYVGIDEFLILNESQQPFCSVIPESRFIESFVDPTIRH